MPRYSQPQRNTNPQSDEIKKESEIENGRNSMPDPLSMGNEAMKDMLSGGGPLIIPLSSGNERMSLVIEPDQEDEKVSESDQSQSLDDSNMSEIDTSKKALERMRNPKIELVDPKGHGEEIKSESEAPKVVNEAEEHADNRGEGQQGDLEGSNKDMKPIQELDFEPVRMKENILKMGGGFLSGLSQFLGITVGKVIGTVFNLGLLPVTGAILAKDFIKSWWNKDSLQERRNHEQIPGWNGAEFEENEAPNNNEVDVDFRKVPAVWSNPIPAKASEPNPNAEDKSDPRQREKPLAPIVSVMVDQPEEGSPDSLAGHEMGHTLLGIEYTRFSKITNRYERYRIKYGFYPAGSVQSMSGSLMMLSRDAVLPGQLCNDVKHKYSISRRFKARPEQVNAILRASETYADKGYNYFTRNCTTFVKDMVQDVGQITRLAPAIFQEDAVQFGWVENLALFGSKAFNLNAEAGTENMLIDLGRREDQSYQNFGNKRVTREDFQNYKKSIDHGITPNKYAGIPGMVGENLRRASGEHAGEIDSFKYAGSLISKDGGQLNLSLRAITDACENETEDLRSLVKNILEEADMVQVPVELRQLITDISDTGYSLLALDRKTRDYCKDKKIDRGPNTELEALSPDDIRETRAALDADISRLQTLLRIFKNDQRLHMPVVHLISLVNYGCDCLDLLYRKIRKGNNNAGELGDIRGEMEHNSFEVSAGGKTAEFTPTLYEAYLQMYKTPEAAVKNRAVHQELLQKLEAEEDLTAAEEKEYFKYERIKKNHRFLCQCA